MSYIKDTDKTNNLITHHKVSQNMNKQLKINKKEKHHKMSASIQEIESKRITQSKNEIKTESWGWRRSSAVDNVHCSYRGPELDVQRPCWIAQHCLYLQLQGSLMPRTHVHTPTCTCVNTPPHTFQKDKIQKKDFELQQPLFPKRQPLTILEATSLKDT